jgi:hypothetical protein
MADRILTVKHTAPPEEFQMLFESYRPEPSESNDSQPESQCLSLLSLLTESRDLNSLSHNQLTSLPLPDIRNLTNDQLRNLDMNALVSLPQLLNAITPDRMRVFSPEQMSTILRLDATPPAPNEFFKRQILTAEQASALTPEQREALSPMARRYVDIRQMSMDQIRQLPYAEMRSGWTAPSAHTWHMDWLTTAQQAVYCGSHHMEFGADEQRDQQQLRNKLGWATAEELAARNEEARQRTAEQATSQEHRAQIDRSLAELSVLRSGAFYRLFGPSSDARAGIQHQEERLREAADFHLRSDCRSLSTEQLQRLSEYFRANGQMIPQPRQLSGHLPPSVPDSNLHRAIRIEAILQTRGGR